MFCGDGSCRRDLPSMIEDHEGWLRRWPDRTTARAIWAPVRPDDWCAFWRPGTRDDLARELVEADNIRELSKLAMRRVSETAPEEHHPPEMVVPPPKPAYERAIEQAEFEASMDVAGVHPATTRQPK